MLGWDKFLGVDCGSRVAHVCSLRSFRMVTAMSAYYNVECWQLDYSTVVLNDEVVEEVLLKDSD